MTRPFIISGNLWVNISQFFFLCAAVFKDVLLIRGFVAIAYGSLIMNTIIGGASGFGIYNEHGVVVYDLLIWAIFICSLHTIAVVRMINDLWSTVELPTDDYESIWRCFYRRCGMQKLEFMTIVKHSTIEEYKSGDLISDNDRHRSHAFFVIEGIITSKQSDHENNITEEKYYSGELFDLYLFNVFGIRIDPGQCRLESHAFTDCKVMIISLESLNNISKYLYGPALPNGIKNLLLFQISTSYIPRIRSNGKYYDSYIISEDKEFYDGKRSRDFSKFTDEEDKIVNKSYTFLQLFPRFFEFCKANFSLFVPHGLRNMAVVPLPSNKIRNEVMKTCVGDNILITDDIEGKESKGQTPNFLNNNKYNIVESEIELKNFSSEIELEKVV